ncbi:MAG: metallophosphoesterase [Hellea sp.]
MIYKLLSLFGCTIAISWNLVSAALAQSSAVPTAPPTSYSWTQYGWEMEPDSSDTSVRVTKFVVRHITQDRSCPALTVDGSIQNMMPRTTTRPDMFDVLVCESYLNTDVTAINLNGKALPVPIAHPETVIVIGDTGCRSASQRCYPSDKKVSKYEKPYWFYDKVAHEAANDPAAHKKPDLIVHVGDMHYREQWSEDCSVFPFNGACWASWEADFFIPSQALFEAAPLIMARGNHEACSRSWTGWFYFLDPAKLDAKLNWNDLDSSGCAKNMGPGISNANYTPTYAIEFDDLQILMPDTSMTTYDRKNKFEPKEYTSRFNEMSALYNSDPKKPTWIVTHQPFWALLYSERGGGHVTATIPFGGKTMFGSGGVIGNMSDGPLKQGLLGESPTIDAIIAGHIHLSETIEFNDSRPHQLVAGASGTKLEHIVNESGFRYNRAISKIGAKSFKAQDSFDYFIMTYNSTNSSWDAAVQIVNTNAQKVTIGGR